METLQIFPKNTAPDVKKCVPLVPICLNGNTVQHTLKLMVNFLPGSKENAFSKETFTHLGDSRSGALLVTECNEARAAVEAGHGIHHQSEIPDLSALLEQRDQLIFKHLPGYLPTEHLIEYNKHTSNSNNSINKTAIAVLSVSSLFYMQFK